MIGKNMASKNFAVVLCALVVNVATAATAEILPHDLLNTSWSNTNGATLGFGTNSVSFSNNQTDDHFLGSIHTGRLNFVGKSTKASRQYQVTDRYGGTHRINSSASGQSTLSVFTLENGQIRAFATKVMAYCAPLVGVQFNYQGQSIRPRIVSGGCRTEKTHIFETFSE